MNKWMQKEEWDMLRLGIDVGKQRVDCIVMDEKMRMFYVSTRSVIKHPLSGMKEILEEMKQQGIRLSDIKQVIISASSEYEEGLRESEAVHVCAIRIGSSQNSLPPFYEVTDIVRETVQLTCVELSGGHYVDGSPIQDLMMNEWNEKMDRAALPEHATFAVTSAFSPVNPEHEQTVAQWIQKKFGEGRAITLSYEFGSIGLMERENAAILNAALSSVIPSLFQNVKQVLRQYDIHAGIFLSQNDGFLMTYERTISYPIRTLHSRIANSLRGASLLAGREDCIVVIVENKRLYIGMVEEGIPKLRWSKRDIAGMYMHVHIPEVVMIDNIIHGASDEVLERVYQATQRFQPPYEPLPIVFVGNECSEIAGRFHEPWAEVIQPEYFSYASAIGACMAPVGGWIERMYWLSEGTGKTQVIEKAAAEAIKEAILAGAEERSIALQSVKVSPLAYVPNQALRIQVRAFGNFA
ncbi:hydantoinase/oxoprolinase N-terminal domain-containing protein [Aneurinibacillus aneurinilyticus]|uniref:hydantoinase/oxoprolinase N-terminal domain-containing protein n=1 Tax=Aneurinibacillus aneurinilyticus TaxID=1391 RepID=UPI002E243D8E|nr:hydantoinase/oxoprolinase N-terminal domain-containing protein [Aneurinibacillus aneurinilyticus]